MIVSEIFKAISILAYAIFIIGAYQLAKQANMDWKKVLLKGAMFVGIFAFLAAVMLGNPTCTDSEYDTRGSTCNEYADDGFNPSSEHRIATFAFYFTLFYVPVLFAAYQKKNKFTES